MGEIGRDGGEIRTRRLRRERRYSGERRTIELALKLEKRSVLNVYLLLY